MSCQRYDWLKEDDTLKELQPKEYGYRRDIYMTQRGDYPPYRLKYWVRSLTKKLSRRMFLLVGQPCQENPDKQNKFVKAYKPVKWSTRH